MRRHERFEELAALAGAGELSPLEWKHLQEHMTECADCRQTFEAFADVGWNDLGVCAADREPINRSESGPAGEGATEESLKVFRRRLRQRGAEINAPAERPAAHGFAGKEAGRSQTSRLEQFTYGLAAMVLLTAGIAGTVWVYSARTMATERTRLLKLQATADTLRKQNDDLQKNANTALTRSFDDGQKVRDALSKALTASDSRNADLVVREKDVEAKLARAIADTERLKQEVTAKDADQQRLTKLQRDAEGRLHDALKQLDEARQSSAAIAATSATSNLDADVDAQPLSDNSLRPYPTEVEARDLFGARNLHIVDVYDVMGDGKTRRTFGRVYYVEKQVLVFYAFDLQERQNHKRSVFQAWGYREANAGKALNLGVFAVDDSSVGRWVLTVNRPDVLSHIDAVFVTSEPPGGSTSPRGKKVLYANLAWPANHP